jgi:hypothetical protein
MLIREDSVFLEGILDTWTLPPDELAGPIWDVRRSRPLDRDEFKKEYGPHFWTGGALNVILGREPEEKSAFTFDQLTTSPLLLGLMLRRWKNQVPLLRGVSKIKDDPDYFALYPPHFQRPIRDLGGLSPRLDAACREAQRRLRAQGYYVDPNGVVVEKTGKSGKPPTLTTAAICQLFDYLRDCRAKNDDNLAGIPIETQQHIVALLEPFVATIEPGQVKSAIEHRSRKPKLN